ncbi:MAG TPA: anti-sigma factor [Dehalococcoidia bacterium]|nr:anti-sigma factor [Dehalococcoidia bacterium]
MDCSEIRELLDAYAISATSRAEADSVERHVADCVRCWEELSKAQRTAALLALSVPMEEAPPAIGARLMAEARRDLAGIHTERRAPLLQRLRFGWSTAAAGLGAASVAALAFAGFLQAQVNDLRDENQVLQSEISAATVSLAQQNQALASASETQASLIRLAGETTSVEMTTSPQAEEEVSVAYTWSTDHRSGVVTCQDLADPPEGKVYQVWFSAGGSRYPAASFTPEDGSCLIAVDVPDGWREPTGVGISLEDPEAVANHPQDGWLAYAYLGSGY